MRIFPHLRELSREGRTPRAVRRSVSDAGHIHPPRKKPSIFILNAAWRKKRVNNAHIFQTQSAF